MRAHWRIAVCVAAAFFCGRPTAAQNAMGNRSDDAAAVKAFEAMLPVLHDPRCLNCHSRGDDPRVGDDGQAHPMNVRRGPDGEGVPGARCSTCHMDHNAEGLHAPPGAPGWGLPSPMMPMIWQGLSDHQLCELIKDPKQNGNRELQQIVTHVETPLVQWAWHPGEGRKAPPISSSEFVSDVKAWVGNDGACPQ